MFDRYKDLKKRLQQVDDAANGEVKDWERLERWVKADDRIWWLLTESRLQMAVALVVFFVAIGLMLFIGSTYELVTGPYGFGSAGPYQAHFDKLTILDGIMSEARALWWRLRRSGLALAVSSLAIPAVYLWGAASIKRRAFAHTDGPSIGAGGHVQEGINVYVVHIAGIAMIVYAVLSPENQFLRLSSWWQIGIAGAIAAMFVEEAVEKVADAVNVRMSVGRTITRDYGHTTVRRSYLK